MRPRKRPNRTSAMAASVPSTVAAVADSKAMRSVTQADSSMARSLSEFDVPARRPAAPNGDEPRGVERIDHQDDDRQIEEGQPQRDRADIEPGRFAHGQRPPCGIARLHLLVDHDRHDQQAEQHHRDRGRHRPVLVGEELGPQGLADHHGLRAAEQIGDDELADDRNEAKHAPAITPGSDSGSVTSQNAFHRGQPRSAAASISVSSIFSSVA